MLQALALVRQQYEKLYTDTCTIYAFEKKLNADMSTELTEIVTCENQPCRLSIKSNSNAVDNETASQIAQNIELFISPDIEVKPGSNITVIHEGRTVKYKNSGVTAVYPTHQEIILELDKERA